jgi:hypothetical protein
MLDSFLQRPSVAAIAKETSADTVGKLELARAWVALGQDGTQDGDGEDEDEDEVEVVGSRQKKGGKAQSELENALFATLDRGMEACIRSSGYWLATPEGDSLAFSLSGDGNVLDDLVEHNEDEIL